MQLGLGHRGDEAPPRLRGGAVPDGIGSWIGDVIAGRITGGMDAHTPMLRFCDRAIPAHPHDGPRPNGMATVATGDSEPARIHPMSTILVTGASGFVGQHIVPALLDAGHHVVALVRTPNSGEAVADRLAPAQRADLELRTGDVTRPDSLPAALAGVDGVVHLVAIPRDFRGGADLRLINTEGTRAVVQAMTSAGVLRLVHMGALGVQDEPDLHYASSKAKAEALVRESGLDWTILKPSLQFGPGDGFFNIIADLVRLSPGIVPVPGNGGSRFQPIHVDDVARVAVDSFSDPSTIKSSFELGGPRYWTYKEITQEVLRALDKRRLIVPMPVPIIRLVARVAEFVRFPFPVATDQLRQLKLDNIGPLDVIPTRFGFQPRGMEGQLAYLRQKKAEQVAGGR